MTPEETQKAELTLVLAVEELHAITNQKKFVENLGCSWEEYLYLKQKYSRILARYKLEKGDKKHVL